MSLPMIINIAGTSGAGKSTIAREVKSRALTTDAIHVEGRRPPVGYRLLLPGVFSPVVLAGAYEAAGTGGCDTIKDAEYNYDLIKSWWSNGWHVVYEGLFVMNHTRGPRLWAETKSVTVPHLQTPLDECIRRVLQRRADVGNTKTLNTKNTEGNFVRANNFATKMSFVGATRIKITTEQGPDTILRLLKQREAET